ncbi:hypothetical protein [Natronosalvus halobius]|uniref:hypothetical protein n=1 Tax=Natronosalvus halobius TaxID=2953746 RepID=UPI0020A074FC|nr:hypothetical protein [Natronosalvus halobius]USZ71829.1 hypothetical protein NGM15_00535 [Natronosalvus halobius]
MLRAPDERALRRELADVFEGVLPALETNVLTWIVLEYPGTRPTLLPETLRNDLAADASEIETAIHSLVERGLFADVDPEDETDGPFLEPIADGEFVDRLIEWIRENGTEARAMALEAIADDLEHRLADERVERRADVISQASSRRGTETFKRDLDWEAYTGVTELCLAAFSLETIPGFLEESLSEALENGVDVRITLLHPDLGVELERPRVGEEIEAGIRSIERLEREHAESAGTLTYRLIREREDAHFFGLLVHSRNDQECTYRVFVRELGRERGVSSILLRGRDQTTVYRLLSRYFDRAWENAHRPGLAGLIGRNWIYGLAVVPLLGLYLWATGTIDDLSFALVQAVAIPIAAELIKDVVLAAGDH